MPDILPVLVVDDDTSFLESVCDSLEQAGYRVAKATSVPGAFELLRKTGFSAVVTDLMMHGLKGEDLMKQVRAFKPGLPVIIMTAVHMEPAQAAELKKQADALLIKPFPMGEMIRILNATAGKPSGPATTPLKPLSGTVPVKPLGAATTTTPARPTALPPTPPFTGARPGTSNPVVPPSRPAPTSAPASSAGDSVDQLLKPNIHEHTYVLLIDDDPRMLDTVKDILEDEKIYEITTADSGIKALSVIQTMPRCDAVVTDFNLPDTTGLDLVRQIRMRGDDIVFLLMTGNASLDMAIRAIQHEVYDYMIKPVDPNHLKKSLHRGLEKQRLSRTVRKLVDALRKSNEKLSSSQSGNRQVLMTAGNELKVNLGTMKAALEALRMSSEKNWTDSEKRNYSLVQTALERLAKTTQDIQDAQSSGPIV